MIYKIYTSRYEIYLKLNFIDHLKFVNSASTGMNFKIQRITRFMPKSINFMPKSTNYWWEFDSASSIISSHYYQVIFCSRKYSKWKKYDQLLFGRLINLTADIKGSITDYARVVLKDQRSRNQSIEHRFI